jgi:tetratricopeptide (TPR) repeat protein
MYLKYIKTSKMSSLRSRLLLVSGTLGIAASIAVIAVVSVNHRQHLVTREKAFAEEIAETVDSRPQIVSPTDNAKITEKANSLLQQGNELLQRRRLPSALEKFQKAYEILPDPRLHYPIAQAYRLLDRPLNALIHYELFIRDIKHDDYPRQWEAANQWVVWLQGQVATIKVSTASTDAVVSVDGNKIGTTPIMTPIRLLPGAHVLVASKEGYEQRVVNLKLAPGETRLVKVELRILEGRKSETTVPVNVPVVPFENF